MSEPVSVTLRAYKALYDDNLIREKYATPGDVLEHLTGNEDFKSLADNLKEAMIKKGFCNTDSENTEFINALHERLSALETSVPEEIPDLSGASVYLDKYVKNVFKKTHTVRETVKRWITGYTQRTNDYNTLVKICFALELELTDATEFLNKNGFNGFNIRNPLDAIYIYCILNQRPFSTAPELLLKYLHTPAKAQSASGKEASESDNTTRQLENAILKDSSWESDEEFLSTFLIPHKEMFTEYSKTAYAEYEKLKNPFYLTAIKMSLDEEADAAGRKIRSDYKRKAHKRNYGELLLPEVKKSDTKITYNFKSALKQYSEKNAFIKEMYNKMDFGIESDSQGHTYAKNNLSAICDEIGRYMKKNRDERKIQLDLSEFMSEVMSGDYCLFKMLPAVIGENTRKKPYGLSDLSDTVLFLFPHRQPMATYEKWPASAGNGVYIRKALILMYYFAFAYEFSANVPGTTYFADILSEYDFSSFIEEVNDVLIRCRFAPLYPANRFDWLVLRSVRQFEICDPDEDLSDCISFFNDVLELSFHESMT